MDRITLCSATVSITIELTESKAAKAFGIKCKIHRPLKSRLLWAEIMLEFRKNPQLLAFFVFAPVGWPALLKIEAMDFMEDGIDSLQLEYYKNV